MAKSKGTGPTDAQVIQAARQYQRQGFLILRSFAIILCQYKKIAIHWHQMVKRLVRLLGNDWCDAKIECLARVGAGTLPLGIMGKVWAWTKLQKMSLADATSLLSCKKFPVRSGTNFQSVSRLEYDKMTEYQQRILIGDDGTILAVRDQMRPAVPKTMIRDAEGCRLTKDYFDSWYTTVHGKIHTIRVPIQMFKVVLKNKRAGI